MKLLSLLFVFRIMHVAVCSCRLRRVRPVCVCELLVDWNFPGTQFVVENFTFLFPLDKYFSFTMKCAPSLALSAKLKNKPKLNESSTLWSNEWTSMVLKSLKSSLLNRMSAPQNAYARQSTSTVFYYVQHKRLDTIFFFLQTTNPIIRLKTNANPFSGCQNAIIFFQQIEYHSLGNFSLKFDHSMQLCFIHQSFDKKFQRKYFFKR